MICRPPGEVATLAIHRTDQLVIEVGGKPGSRGVTGRTLPWEVVGRLAVKVTALAIHGAHRSMIES